MCFVFAEGLMLSALSWRVRAWILLGVTILTLILAIGILGAEDGNNGGRNASFGSDGRGEIAILILLGGVLLVGCLYVYPKALLEKTDISNENRPTAENELRTLLVEVVGGAFLLVGVYFAYGQLKETANQAVAAREQIELTKRQLTDQRYENALDRLASNSVGIRALGATGIVRIAKELEPAERDSVYSALVALIQEHAVWTNSRQAVWDAALKQEGRSAEDDPTVGIGSLRRRAADVQAALLAIGAIELERELRADLRNLDLQGAALGHAKLSRALFNGAHLDYLDVRTHTRTSREPTSEGPACTAPTSTTPNSPMLALTLQWTTRASSAGARPPTYGTPISEGWSPQRRVSGRPTCAGRTSRRLGGAGPTCAGRGSTAPICAERTLRAPTCAGRALTVPT
jgi:hypothetical protein